MKIIDFLKDMFFGSKSFAVVADDKITELSLYRLALTEAVSIISSALSRYEFVIYKNGKRTENEDWYALNIEPNRNQTKQEFFYDLVYQLVFNGEALCVDIGTERFVADSFTSDIDSCGFGTALFSHIEKNGVQLDASFDASQVMYFKLDNPELRKLLIQAALEYTALLTAAGKKFKNSAYHKGILKISTQAGGNAEKEAKQNEQLNAAIRKFYQDGNAVLPLRNNFNYEELGKYRNSGDSSNDVSSMTFQVYSRVAEALNMSPYILMHSSKEPETLKADFYKNCVERYVNIFVVEVNRKQIGRKMYLGLDNHAEIRMLSERPYDIDELIKDGTAIFNAIGSGTVSIDEMRMKQGKRPLNTEWSRAHYISLNLKRIDNMTYNGGNNE